MNTKWETGMRDPSIVMDPERLGAMHQNRISFARSIVRKIAREKWEISCDRWDLSEEGFGTAIYKVKTKHSEYNLVLFPQYIRDDERNDRVIAVKWDVPGTFTIGPVNNELVEDMRANVPLQEAGRNTSHSLVLLRANKSVRIFEHMVNSLSEGRQPDVTELKDVGYIIRTTAVYANGKFGVADFGLLKNNPDFETSFSPQMCAVYLFREFSIDWVNFLARKRGGDGAVVLSREIARYIGVGNATGLGMAPFLIDHPRVLDKWLTAREKAVAAVSRQDITTDKFQEISILINNAVSHLSVVQTINENQQRLNETALGELNKIETDIRAKIGIARWRSIIEENQKYSYEAQEIVISGIVELYPELVDRFEAEFNTDETLSLRSGLRVRDIIKRIAERYQWAIGIDFAAPENNYRFWYKSREKEEPRVGIRRVDAGEELELPLDIARQVSCFYKVLLNQNPEMSLVDFFQANPRFRMIARRIWTMSDCAMGDIQINVLNEKTLPLYLLRCKLAIFGATKFDPRSDRWVRVTLFQGAPLLDEIDDREWLFPQIPQESHQEVMALR